jgi:hypothetical protein
LHICFEIGVPLKEICLESLVFDSEERVVGTLLAKRMQNGAVLSGMRGVFGEKARCLLILRLDTETEFPVSLRIVMPRIEHSVVGALR